MRWKAVIPLLQEAILLTKIRPPVPRANGIARERLTARLAEASRGRLTLVCAPAGFGKTTLLSQWAQEAPGFVAWYSLDETDNDLMKFWRTFVRSLSPLAPRGLNDRIDSLLQAYPNATMSAILDSLLNELQESLSTPLAIVLDDYHAIADERIHDTLGYFIDRAPAGVRLVIASRSAPPLRTAKWNARGERHELTAKHLSFTTEEAARFCRESAGLPLSDDRIGLLMQWTEGWPASLQLASLTIGEEKDWDRFFEHYKGADRNLTQYLLEEVFAGLAPELRDFLLRTSVLSRFDADACDALTLGTDSGRRLEELQRRNLFLSPLGPAGAWFRYHHLFSQFLREQLDLLEPGLAPELHRRAAAHLFGRGLADEAMEHALEARDWALSARILGGHVQTILRNGQLATLLRWMGRMPPEAAPPELSLLYAFALVVTGQFERARAEVDRLEGLLAGMETNARSRELQSGLFFVKVNLAFTSGDYEQWYAYADRLPGMLPESPAFYYFNYNTNETFLRRTLFGLRGMQTAETETIAHRITGIMESHGWGGSLFTLYIYQSLAEGYYDWNRQNDSAELVRRIEPYALKHGIPGLYVPNRITAAKLFRAAGDAEAAFAALEEAREEAARMPESAHWTRCLLSAEAALHVQEGNLPQAEKILSALGLAPQDKPTPFTASAYEALSRLLGARRKEREALKLLEELKRLNRREGILIGLAENAALLALIESQRGRRAQAFSHLAEALLAGEPNGYVRTFVDEGKPMESLLRQYLEHCRRQAGNGGDGRPQPSLEYVAKLLDAFPRKEPAAAGNRLLAEPLTDKETAVLLEAVRGAGNREIAQRLHLTEGTVKVYLSRIYAKLGVSSRIQALHRAEELRLFELG